MAKNNMDDVDRLFACFKCGVTPPESAMREGKTSKSRLKHENTSHENSKSPGSVGEGKTRSAHLQSQKLGSVADKVNKATGGKQISPVVFYGSPHGVPPKRPSSLLRVLREIHIDLAGRRKSNLRSQIWATFPKQDEAVKFTKEHANENVRIFSYQDHFNGQRRFLVSTYQEFWRRYKNMNPRCRHHYEVIQEGLPCHLYFDLEFNRLENREKDGDQMVDLLVSVIFEALNEKYQLHGEQDWVVELDSSTEAKFSRHLVLRIPKAAFKDNSHAGAFVSEICSRIRNASEKDARFQQLFVIKDSSCDGCPTQLFVDNAVYSRNRCFRLALSSKAGKTSVLLPTGRFKCKDMCEENVFMASLICNLDDDCEKFLVCKMDLDCIKTLQYDTEINTTRRMSASVLRQFTSNGCKSEEPKTYLMGTSPFPALDAFIESVASFGSVTGKIRSWYWFSEDELMVYSMSTSRYCERIGREHKSNHVMFVVDLRWALYYQKCYDPDCRGYRSPSRPILADVIPETSNLRQTVDNHQEHNLLFGDENTTEDETNDGWWLEAMKVADTVENTRNLSTSTMDNASEEDDEWWMEVEKTACQAELNCHC
ncbi:hypothetical protein RND81_12G110100 [Saponaria officinalis]|uniref:DNA-directed primase/polymerase protein n=1 Tax=Saponaria officinalis TaxID=3572 RepID=A0AAW1H984_SAPOF